MLPLLYLYLTNYWKIWSLLVIQLADLGILINGDSLIHLTYKDACLIFTLKAVCAESISSNTAHTSRTLWR